MKKRFFIGFIAIITCFVMTGCSEKENKPNTSENGNNNQQEQNNVDNLGIGKYRVEKKDNVIIVTTNDGSAISKTEYKFSNDELVSAIVTEKCTSSTLAKTIYETMKNEPTIMAQYSDIKINGDTITLTIKNETLSVYKGMDFNTIYNLMYETYSAYME